MEKIGKIYGRNDSTLSTIDGAVVDEFEFDHTSINIEETATNRKSLREETKKYTVRNHNSGSILG